MVGRASGPGKGIKNTGATALRVKCSPEILIYTCTRQMYERMRIKSAADVQMSEVLSETSEFQKQIYLNAATPYYFIRPWPPLSFHRHKFCTVHQGMAQLNCPRPRAYHHAGPTVVALPGVHHDRMFSLFFRRQQYIALADCGTAIAADAQRFIIFQWIRAARHRFYCKFNSLQTAPPPIWTQPAFILLRSSTSFM